MGNLFSSSLCEMRKGVSKSVLRYPPAGFPSYQVDLVDWFMTSGFTTGELDSLSWICFCSHLQATHGSGAETGVFHQQVRIKLLFGIKRISRRSYSFWPLSVALGPFGDSRSNWHFRFPNLTITGLQHEAGTDWRCSLLGLVIVQDDCSCSSSSRVSEGGQVTDMIGSRWFRGSKWGFIRLCFGRMCDKSTSIHRVIRDIFKNPGTHGASVVLQINIQKSDLKKQNQMFSMFLILAFTSCVFDPGLP